MDINTHHRFILEEWNEKYSSLVDKIFENRNISSFLDIGANSGAVIQFLLSRRNISDVYAFEPVEQNFSFLKHHVAPLFGNETKITAFQCAVYYGVTRASAFGCGDNNPGGMFLSNVREEYTKSINTYDTGITFDCKTLEECLPHIDSIDLCKIDVEGSEWNILQNSEFLKNKVNDILLEYHWISEDEAKSFLRDHLPQFQVSDIVSNTIWISRISPV